MFHTITSTSKGVVPKESLILIIDTLLQRHLISHDYEILYCTIQLHMRKGSNPTYNVLHSGSVDIVKQCILHISIFGRESEFWISSISYKYCTALFIKHVIKQTRLPEVVSAMEGSPYFLRVSECWVLLAVGPGPDYKAGPETCSSDGEKRAWT